MTMFIVNLPHQATQVDLLKLFEKYGSVKRIMVPTDWKANKIIGFAFVEMFEKAAELLAISELNGAKWMGYQLQVRKSYSPNTTLILNRYPQIGTTQLSLNKT